MERKEILNKIIEIVVEQLGQDISVINEKSNLINDLGADSLDTVELVMAIEEEFKIDISDTESENITDIQSIVDYIQSVVK